MSGYDETNPEAYRPTEPEAAADSAHSGVDSWSASSQASPATAASGSEGASATEDHGGYADLSQAYTADASHPEPPTSQLPAEPPTSQLPAEQSASLYAQPAQGSTSPSSRPTSRSSSLRASTPLLRCSRRRRPATHPPSSPTRGSRRTSARPT